MILIQGLFLKSLNLGGRKKNMNKLHKRNKVFKALVQKRRKELEKEKALYSNACYATEDKELMKIYDGKNGKLNYATIKSVALKNRLKFAHGPCNQTIMVPGLFASRIDVQIQCEEIRKEGKTLKEELDFYCGEDLCKKEHIVEHTYWISVIGGGEFNLKTGGNNPNNSCMGFFLKFYNNGNSCVSNSGKKLCRHSRHIRFLPSRVR